MKKSRHRIHTILGSRKPVVVARLVNRCPETGSIQAQTLVAENGTKKAKQIVTALQRIFLQGADRLKDNEWCSLFALQTPRPDQRWTLLVRLATEPEGDESKLRDQFVALPDGTAFSMRLLLLSKQGGARVGARAQNGDPLSLSFNRLPDVARLVAFARARSQLAADSPVTRKDFADNVWKETVDLGLPVARPTVKDVTDRLFKKIKDNGGKEWLPTLANTGRGRKRSSNTTAVEELRDG